MSEPTRIQQEKAARDYREDYDNFSEMQTQIDELERENAALKAKLDEPWQRKAAARLREIADASMWFGEASLVLKLADQIEAEGEQC